MCGARAVVEDVQRDTQCAIQVDADSVRRVSSDSRARFVNTRKNSQDPGWMELYL